MVPRKSTDLKKWTNCNKYMMMQEGRVHKHFALQLDVRAYKYQTQKLEHLFQGRVPDKSSEVVFQATANCWWRKRGSTMADGLDRLFKENPEIEQSE